MAHSIVKNVHLKIDNAAGSLTDLSGDINSVGLTVNGNPVEDTALNATAVSMLGGGVYGWSMPISGFVNSTTDAIFGPASKGTSVSKTVQYQPKGAVMYYAGETFPEGYEVSGEIGSVQVFSVNLVGDGALNRTSVAV